VAAYHSRDLAHLDLHDGNVIVGDLHVKIIDPMYLATTGMQSLRTRERAQQRDVRNMCGLLVDLLNTVQVQSDAVARLARSSTGVTVEIKADPVLSTHG
jgi:tRNA A-37 threonylcarbamoyl transferase component Bud32